MGKFSVIINVSINAMSRFLQCLHWISDEGTYARHKCMEVFYRQSAAWCGCFKALHNTHNCSALISFKINRKIQWICRDHQDYFTVQNRKQCKEHSTHFSQGVPTDSTDCSVEVVLPDEQRHTEFLMQTGNHVVFDSYQINVTTWIF